MSAAGTKDARRAAEAWIRDYCERRGLNPDALSLGEQLRLAMQVPCTIRCWRVGDAVILENGRCPECGRFWE